MSKIANIKGVPEAELKKVKASMEYEVFFFFNKNGSFKSSADAENALESWSFTKKTNTILLKGKRENFECKILHFKPKQMLLRMNFNNSLFGEMLFVKM